MSLITSKHTEIFCSTLIKSAQMHSITKCQLDVLGFGELMAVIETNLLFALWI